MGWAESGCPVGLAQAEELTLEKQKALGAKVVGTYESKDSERFVFLENGIVEGYLYGEKAEIEFKWKISEGGELYVTEPNGNITFCRINKDSSITFIAEIGKDGKRNEAPKEEQRTLKNIK